MDLDVTISRSIDGRASIFTAESVAVLDAAKMASRSADRNVLVVSDSLSALLTLSSKSFGVDSNPYILEIKRVCYLFNKDSDGQFRISFLWVPGHIGIRGNERVDYLAKAASSGEVDRSIALLCTDLALFAGK